MLGLESVPEIPPLKFPLWVKAVFPLSVPETPNTPQMLQKGKLSRGQISSGKLHKARVCMKGSEKTCTNNAIHLCLTPTLGHNPREHTLHIQGPS